MEETSAVQRGQELRCCSQLARQRKSNVEWPQGIAAALSVTLSRQITQQSSVFSSLGGAAGRVGVSAAVGGGARDLVVGAGLELAMELLRFGGVWRRCM